LRILGAELAGIEEFVENSLSERAAVSTALAPAR
jgi:hypothetical protein